MVLFMEYIKGGELTEYLNKNLKLTEFEAKLVIEQLVETVEYMHQHKIVHRDLKLQNILLEEKDDLNHIKIIDFGIAGVFNCNSPDESTAGTLKYLPPEV